MAAFINDLGFLKVIQALADGKVIAGMRIQVSIHMAMPYS